MLSVVIKMTQHSNLKFWRKHIFLVCWNIIQTFIQAIVVCRNTSLAYRCVSLGKHVHVKYGFLYRAISIPGKTAWASSWENVSSGVCDHIRLKRAYSATGASVRLEILVTETRDITLSRQRTTKALIRLRGCASWSAPLLFAYDIRHVFSWPGSV